jgi:hypothetical protein
MKMIFGRAHGRKAGSRKVSLTLLTKHSTDFFPGDVEAAGTERIARRRPVFHRRRGL